MIEELETLLQELKAGYSPSNPTFEETVRKFVLDVLLRETIADMEDDVNSV